MKCQKQGPAIHSKQRCEKRKRESSPISTTSSSEMGVSSVNVSIDNDEVDVNSNEDPDYHFKKPLSLKL